VVAPDELEAIKETGGRKPSGFQAYSYIDARDLALAFRLAVVRPLPGAAVMFVVADDSTIAEPLSELYPRIQPSIGNKAIKLTGCRAAYANARAKELLGWKPVYSWRND
jgi:nucleoside-diphosphate-sugar epimerase